MFSGLIEGIIGLIFTIFQSTASGIIQLFFPQLSDAHRHFRENWKRYATFSLYAFLTLSFLGGLFLFCLLSAFFFNSWLSFGMQIQRFDVDFDMARQNGLKWGYDAPSIEDSQFEDDLNEFILSKESASSFGSFNHRDSHYHFEDDSDYSEFMSTIKKSKKEILKLKNKLKSQAADSMRCVQKAAISANLRPAVDFTMSISFVTPESHYQRLEANTPLQITIGDRRIIKPIPTPSRSYLLSTLRTIFYSPYLILGLMPETNDIEISLYGGANQPFKSEVAENVIELLVESCDLQILDAMLVVTPTKGWFQSALARFPLIFLFLTASIFNVLALVGISLSGLVYVRLSSSSPSPVVTKESSSQKKDANSNVEDISLRRESDSWSECSESPVS